MNRVEQHLAERLAARKASNNLRHLPHLLQGVDFYSNDYLGLASHGVLADALSSMQMQQPTGATGSRLLSGNSTFAEELEQRIATFHKAEAALLFNSGYDANIGLLSAIADRHTTIVYDELCHASIIDGVRLSLCGRKYSFGHNNLNELEDMLSKGYNGPVIVVTESVFSMDGDRAPLKEIVVLCENYGAQLIVDEAHAIGVFGKQGEGLVCTLGLADRVFARVHTYGKAMGCHGAAVVGSKVLQHALVNFARSFIYTTALPGHSLAAISVAYDLIGSGIFNNQPLHELIEYFRNSVAGMNGWIASDSAIQAYVAGDTERCRQLATGLMQAGMQVSSILHPTVAKGSERLRVCLHTFNTQEEIDTLIACIKQQQ